MMRMMRAGLIMLLMWCVVAPPVWADRDDSHRGRDFHQRPTPGDWRERRDIPERDRRYYQEHGYWYDRRYGHDRYYPPRGYVVRALPPRYRRVPYHGVDYYFSAGIWYVGSGVGFSVVVPPVGLIAPELPPYYTTIWVGATPYYYAGGVYYVWRPSVPGYAVVAPPNDSKINEEASVPEELYVYPKEGQSEQQQATDRYECHRWAVEQTGFDPTEPAGGVPANQHATKHADYQRAMKACLEGRGYSVR